ncbi:MAG: glycosyltransferase family 9 protein [Silvibacterium sp.]|nr:glycosyltransferase family 9 protein [Silvibacterium sp.]MBV8631533.1 glycosyltransferase family 9 protein [Silvibacterium sp.]
MRVLIVRLGAMGDILHALPAITALRSAHPEWYIGWAVEPQWRGLLCSECSRPPSGRSPQMPLVDTIHIVPAKQWARYPLSAALHEIPRIRRELREARYDIVIDLQGAVRSAVIARWARAARLIGEDKPRERAARWLFTERIPTRGVHVIEQGIEVANAVLGESLPVMPALLPTDASAEKEASAITQPFVLLSPGAGWGAKRWPVDRYAAVARQLSRDGYAVVINAGPGEESIAIDLMYQLAGVAGVTMLQPTVTELIAITRRASLLIAGDTGPLHLACALGKPVVGIFGPTDPARNGPFGCAFRVLRHPESRRDHTRHSEPEAGLLTITPEAVLEAAMDLLLETRKETRKASLKESR